MQEERNNHPILDRLFFWSGAIASTVVLVVVGIGVFEVRAYLPIVGLVVVFAIPVVIVGGVLFLAAKALSHALDYKVTEIGPNGNILSRFGKIVQIHPLGLKEYRVKDLEKAKENAKVEVPSVLELLKTGFLGGADLLLGFHLDGTPRYGMWDDLRTFVVAGKSRSGKSVTMVFFILQAVLAGATVYVADPHYKKKDGLLKVLEALIPWLIVARTQEEIIALAKQFTKEMQDRETGVSQNKNPCLFVVDEWTKLLRDLAPFEVEIMVEVFLNCAEAWAAFEGYSMIGGHEWTARESGGKRGAALRKNTHAAFVHRLDSDYAKFLLQGSKGKKAANGAPNLPRGHAHLQDSEGELDYLVIPYYGAKFEAVIEVSQMLVSYPVNPEVTTGEKGQLTTPEYQSIMPPVTSPVDSKQPVYYGGNTGMEPLQGRMVDGYQEENTSLVPFEGEIPENAEAVNGKLTDGQIKTLIVRMVKRGIALRDISYTVSLYGRNYNQFRALCTELNIEIPERV